MEVKLHDTPTDLPAWVLVVMRRWLLKRKHCRIASRSRGSRATPSRPRAPVRGFSDRTSTPDTIFSQPPGKYKNQFGKKAAENKGRGSPLNEWSDAAAVDRMWLAQSRTQNSSSWEVTLRCCPAPSVSTSWSRSPVWGCPGARTPDWRPAGCRNPPRSSALSRGSSGCSPSQIPEHLVGVIKKTTEYFRG